MTKKQQFKECGRFKIFYAKHISKYNMKLKNIIGLNIKYGSDDFRTNKN